MQPGTTTAQKDSGQANADVWFAPGRFAILLGAAIFLTFPGVVLGINSFFFRDYGTLGYPFIHYARESFWRGELPLWNPLSNCGTPFLAQWNTLVFYPPSLIYLLFPLPWSLNYFCLAHLFLAGWGMYLLARRWVGNEFAAALAGMAWVFNGVTLSSHIYPNYLVTLGWMPWVVWLSEKAWREGGRSVVLAALAGTLQMLSGAPELILQTWLLIAALFLGGGTPGRSGALPEMAEPEPGRVRMAWRFTSLILLVAGLSAAQLLPFFDLLAHSQRGPGFAGQLWTMPGWGWASLLVPLFHCYSTPQGVLLQSGQAFLVSYYPGVGVVALALLALWRTQQRRVWLLAALAALSLVMALGENGYLYGWLRRCVPAMGVIRYPIKFVYLAAFLAPLLAAYAACGPAAASGSRRPWRRAVAALGGLLVLIMAWLAWFAWRYPAPGEDTMLTAQSALTRAGLLAALLGAIVCRERAVRPRLRLFSGLAAIALLWLDVQTHTPQLAPVIANSAYTPGLTELKPKPRPGAGRVMISPRAEWLLVSRALPDMKADFIGTRLALWSNLNALEGIPKVNGAATLQLREQADLEAILYGTQTNDFPQLAAFLGVTHVSSPANPVEWVVRTNAMPWVTAGQRAVFAGPDETVRRLLAPDFQPRQVVFLPLEAGSTLTATNAVEVSVTPVRFSAQSIEVEVNASGPAMVVVAQSYYHPWHARVDGQATRLWRANHAFQALEVPAGKHRVRLAYGDSWLRLGAVISALTLAGCFFLYRASGKPTLPAV